MTKSSTMMSRERCDGCGREIDSGVCWCGEQEDAHTALSGHMFVPMGCVCFMERTEEDESGSRRSEFSAKVLKEASERQSRLQRMERAYRRIKAWNDAYMDAERQRQNRNHRRALSRQEEGARNVHQRLAALLRLDNDA